MVAAVSFGDSEEWGGEEKKEAKWREGRKKSQAKGERWESVEEAVERVRTGKGKEVASEGGRLRKVRWK